MMFSFEKQCFYNGAYMLPVVVSAANPVSICNPLAVPSKIRG
jgi:hypothetical protein